MENQLFGTSLKFTPIMVLTNLLFVWVTKGSLLKAELNKLNHNNVWNIKFVNTGLNTMTGGRIKRIKKYLSDNQNFCLSYGDGLSDVNVKKLLSFI